MFCRISASVLVLLSIQFADAAKSPEETLMEELKAADNAAAKKVEALLPQAEAGEPQAMLDLARAYWELVILAQGDVEGVMKESSWNWYEKAAKQQSDLAVGKEAIEELVNNYWIQEQDDRLRIWAEAGNASAQFFLAKRLLREEAREQEVFALYRAAATQGHLEAVQWLSYELESGLYGGKTDLPESLEWLTKGAELGDLEMKYQLARRYQNGYGARWPEFQKDIRKANTLYLEAGNAGHVESLIYLSRLLIRAKSGTNAEIVTNKLMDQNKAEGWFYRGEMYEKGVGREVNLNKARANYKKALDMGYSEAGYAIGRVEAAMSEERAQAEP